MVARASSDPDARAPIAALSQLLLLAAWLGAAAFFAAVVAPAAFDVLPSRELAGALVGRALPVLFVVGILVGLTAFALEALADPRPYRLARRIALCITALACAIAQFGVAPRIAAIRAQFAAPLASLATDDPLRVAFGRLHMLSVAWLGLAIVAAGVAMVLAMMTLRSGDRR
jgi:hypothetical protein